jgi:hypothetical protein
MQSIGEDPEVGVNFLVLIVCRLASGQRNVIELTANAFRAGALHLPVSVSFELEIQGTKVTLAERIRRFLGL